ncbi:MAG TPA: hypothetical protein VLC09_17940 [Polyangiaceae bacterium]|nr:hypothetical protein [Polyangiaceae bacterium]
MLLSATCLSTASGLAAAAPAQADTQDDRETQAQAPVRPAEMPLSLLPEPPALELPPPRPAALEALDGVLARLVSGEPAAREQALGELLEARPDWVGALSRRMDRVAERSDKSAMRALLERLRSRAKDRGSEDDSKADYLALVLESPASDSQTWTDLTQTLAIMRMLRHIGTAESARELIRVYVRFGDFLRIAVQRELDGLGDRQVAALYEARRHPAPKIASWAEKRLDLLGKAIPREAVRTDDAAALSDVLVALGRSRDPDAGRILISFAASDRSQVRMAARQGITALGEVGSWSLRDAYQDTTGKSAPRDWSWKRTARELFTEFDRSRTAKEFELFEAAQKAEKEGRWEEMRQGYDQVLTWSPLFEQREKMAPGYMKYAEQVRSSNPEAAIAAYRRVERIASELALRNRAESLRHTLEARALEASGVVDRGLLDKALALDADNDLASDALERAAVAPHGLSDRTRYLLAAAVAALGLSGSAWIGWSAWRRRREDPGGAPPPDADETENDDGQDAAEDGDRNADGDGDVDGDEASEDQNAAADDGGADDGAADSDDASESQDAANDDGDADDGDADDALERNPK